jgi:hypothetical protein
MASKQKRAALRSQHRPARSSARMPEVQPRGRCVPSDTQRVDLKSRTFEEIATHLQRSSKPVDWNTDEPDVD